MGWVTLVCRKKELTQSKADYQFQNLCLSRQRRQLERSNSLKLLALKNRQSAELAEPKKTYDNAYTVYNSRIKELDAFKCAINKFSTTKGSSYNGSVISIQTDQPTNSSIKTDKNGNILYYFQQEGSTNPVDYAYIEGLNGTALNQDQQDKLKHGEKITVGGQNFQLKYATKDFMDAHKGNTSLVQLSYLDNNSWVCSQDNFSDLTANDNNYVDIIDIPSNISLPSDPANWDTDNILAQISNAKSEASIERENAYYVYTDDTQRIKAQYENEMEMLEEETKDSEDIMDQEQADVETQMESVASELEAVNQAISQEIKNTTIRLY